LTGDASENDIKDSEVDEMNAGLNLFQINNTLRIRHFSFSDDFIKAAYFESSGGVTIRTGR
jgi:hypothetical protein